MTEGQGLRLGKYEGAGNDFLVVVDLEGRRPVSPAEVVALCHRRFGVGADGLIEVRSGRDGAELAMELRNADGGEAEMSGNGIRCLVQAAVDAGVVEAGPVTVSTRAGVRTVEYTASGTPGLGHAAVAMGRAGLGPELEPGDLAVAVASVEPLGVGAVSRALAAGLAGVRRARMVDMGNPHLVLLGEPVGPDVVATVGALLERSVEGGANVEFVWTGPGEGELTMRVWERGVGETLACGTGTCAVAAAAADWGEAGEKVSVHQPGGTLEVVLAADGVTLSGPTRRVATVTIEEAVLAAAVEARA